MKKRIVSLFLAIALAASMCVPAMAAQSTGIAVRVNGQIIEFPDEKPYVDKNNRTMMPIRFVVEALGAEATWLGDIQTAKITKGDICILIPIGSNTLEVTEAGVKRTVTMDTAAIIKNDRTFIPIRFIAEALGAHVDWASYHNVACIYDDVLTAVQIAKLQAYEYTQPKVAVSYEDYRAKHTEAQTIKRYGEDRDTFNMFANAREHLYHTMHRLNNYYFEASGVILTNATTDAFYQMVAKEAAALVGYESERMTVEFLTDTSCIYQADDMGKIGCAVRGIAVVTLHVHPQKLTGAEDAKLVNMGFSQVFSNVPMYIDLDVHMNTMAEYRVDINTIVPLSEAYFTP